MEKNKNKLGTASFIFGLLALIFGANIFGAIPIVLAITLGINGLKKDKKAVGNKKQHKMSAAMLGIIMGCIGLAIALFIILTSGWCLWAYGNCGQPLG